MFGDTLFVRNQINRYEQNLTLYNIRFTKVENVWVIDSHNNTALILEFIKIAEKEYD